MQKYHSLSRKSEQLKELRKSEAALGELCARSSSLLWTRRWHLVQDIQMIYPIEKVFFVHFIFKMKYGCDLTVH